MFLKENIFFELKKKLFSQQTEMLALGTDVRDYKFYVQITKRCLTRTLLSRKLIHF